MENSGKPELDPAGIERCLLGELGRVLADRAGPPAARILVAFSGGLDSSVLLDAITRIDAPCPVAAIHVDHGWHADSAQWGRHCAAVAAGLGLDCIVTRVDAAPRPGESPEAAARAARYRAFASALGVGELLLTAHHGDDQLETLLLRLLRGAGVRGMRGIHADAPLGRGRLLRPLLAFSRRELESIAAHWRIGVLTDPSNADLRLDRNFLRARVVPGLRERWPAAHTVAVRVAAHMEAAETLLATLADSDGGDTAEPDRFPLDRLAALAPVRQANLLRRLIERAGIGMPAERQLTELLRQLSAAPGRAIHVAWHSGEARTFRGHLYLQQPLGEPRSGPAGLLATAARWQGPEGTLELVPAADGIPAAIAAQGLRVEFRRGGERFRPAGSAHHKLLKHWFQERGIVPWMRNRVPLLYAGDEIVAIADLALAALPAQDGGTAWRPRWQVEQRVR